MSWWVSQKLHPKIKNKFLVVFADTFYIPSVKSVNKPKVEFETKEFRLINHMFNYPGNAKWQPVTIKFVDMNGDIDPTNRDEFFDTSSFLWQIMNNTGYRYPYHNISHIRENHYRIEDQIDGSSFGHWISTKIDDESKSSAWRTITTPEKSSTIANSFGLGLSGDADFESASAIKQKISIYQIGPDGQTVELWHLMNPIVKSVGWGELSYDSDELVEYELQIVYDWAVLDRKAAGKPPVFSATSFTDFMKTLYITNEIDLDDDLEKKIEAFRERDAQLDERRIDAIKRAKSLAEPSGDIDEYYKGLEDLARSRTEFRNISEERSEMQEDFDSIRKGLADAGIVESDPLDELRQETRFENDIELDKGAANISQNRYDDAVENKPKPPSDVSVLNLGSTESNSNYGTGLDYNTPFGGLGEATTLPTQIYQEKAEDDYWASQGDWPISTEKEQENPNPTIEFTEEPSELVKPSYLPQSSNEKSPPPPSPSAKSRQADWDETYTPENWTEEQQKKFESDIGDK